MIEDVKLDAGMLEDVKLDAGIIELVSEIVLLIVPDAVVLI